MSAAIAFLTSRLGLGLLGGMALATFLGWGAVSLRDSAASAAKNACESAHETTRLQAVEQQMDATLDEIERGNQISERLIQTQRRLYATKTEYLAYANGIAGNCPAQLGVLTDAAAAGADLPAATGAPADATAPVSAAALGANIAENYARCHANTAQLSALIDWHKKKDLKHE